MTVSATVLSIWQWKRICCETHNLKSTQHKLNHMDHPVNYLSQHISLQKQLSDNETHVQLTNLEKKWSHLEQNNFTLAEFVANRKAELNFEPVKNKGSRSVLS